MATLLEIKTDVYQRANMEYDSSAQDEDRFVTDAELTRLINQGYKELYGYLIRHGMHRAETIEEIEADGSISYGLPDDFFALITVHYVEDDYSILLTRHDHRTRPREDLGGVPAQTYRLIGNTIVFDPVPEAGTYEVRYVPVPGNMADDDDTMDSVLGWEEYVVLYAAAKLLQKEGSTNAAAALKADMRELMVRIQDEAQAAELSEGTVVQNVRTSGSRTIPGDFVVGGRPRGWW